MHRCSPCNLDIRDFISGSQSLHRLLAEDGYSPLLVKTPRSRSGVLIATAVHRGTPIALHFTQPGSHASTD